MRKRKDQDFRPQELHLGAILNSKITQEKYKNVTPINSSREENICKILMYPLLEMI